MVNNLSIIQFIKTFSDERNCYEYMEKIKWPQGVVCPKCDCAKYYVLRQRVTDKAPRVRLQCGNGKCKFRFNVRNGTIFDNCKFPVSTFFYLIYQFCINKKSISSRQSARNIGISQKSTWLASHRIRSVFSDQEKFKLSGIIEIDEAFFSKKNSYKNGFKMWATSNSRKGPILGMIERGGRVIVQMIPNRSESTIEGIVLECVQPESTIYTDGWMGYRNLNKYYDHHWIDHGGGEYGRGEVHTNSIEGFWGFMKKSLRSAHHSVSEDHLQLYLNQVMWQWNNRNLTPMQRFDDLLKRCLSRKFETHYVGAKKETELEVA